MESFVQKWVAKVSNNYAKRVEKGSKMEPKWVQKSSKINTEIGVGKKVEKSDAPATFGIIDFRSKIV